AETHMKMACGDKRAACRVAILDPELTSSMPAGVTSATGIDAISHAVESYVTTKRNPISQLFARRAWKLLANAFPTVVKQEIPDQPGQSSGGQTVDHESARQSSQSTQLAARGSMLLGAHLAGAAIENSMLGATHALANPLTAHYGITHGFAIGVMLPHVIRFNSSAVNAMYGTLAEDIGLCSSDDPSVGTILSDHIQNLVKLSGAPTTLATYNVDRAKLPQLSMEAAKQWTGTFNPRPVDAKSLLELYQAAMEDSHV
ncbi:MAG: iron-containing alcohol dehydrogenase, partial [Planctomycetes bacterium]|nr:iron-containing alcohol dehydrogenase [Planctomycetota bacterium]